MNPIGEKYLNRVYHPCDCGNPYVNRKRFFRISPNVIQQVIDCGCNFHKKRNDFAVEYF